MKTEMALAGLYISIWSLLLILVLSFHGHNEVTYISGASSVSLPAPPPDQCEMFEPVHATVPVSERGISQMVINFGKPSYLTVKRSCKKDWNNPDSTYFEVFYYDVAGRLSKVEYSENRPPTSQVVPKRD